MARQRMPPRRSALSRAAPGNVTAASAADGGHRARWLHEAGLVDAVLELLAPDGVADDRLQLVVADAGAQRRAQVGLVDREEAGPQAALGCDPDAVAVAAERLTDRVDEADPALAVGEAVDAGCGAGL